MPQACFSNRLRDLHRSLVAKLPSRFRIHFQSLFGQSLCTCKPHADHHPNQLADSECHLVHLWIHPSDMPQGTGFTGDGMLSQAVKSASGKSTDLCGINPWNVSSGQRIMLLHPSVTILWRFLHAVYFLDFG